MPKVLLLEHFHERLDDDNEDSDEEGNRRTLLTATNAPHCCPVFPSMLLQVADRLMGARGMAASGQDELLVELLQRVSEAMPVAGETAITGKIS